jgi:hypothetical protein
MKYLHQILSMYRRLVHDQIEGVFIYGSYGLRQYVIDTLLQHSLGDTFYATTLSIFRCENDWW